MTSLSFIPRAVWGSSPATETFIARRQTASPTEKTTIQIHHTAGADNDQTPSRWSYTDAVTYMRKLQTSRPDLGPLPYSENVAVSEDLDTVWLFEGRGILPVGAHTAGHNRDGVGFGILGNFDQGDPPAAVAAIEAIEARCHQLHTDLLPNLGSVPNPRGWQAWGHRDSKQTSCPGALIYPLLATFNMENNMGWTKPGDPINDLTDADRALQYQGSLAPGSGQASYQPADWREANERVWMVLARQADLDMQLDQRIRALE